MLAGSAGRCRRSGPDVVVDFEDLWADRVSEARCGPLTGRPRGGVVRPVTLRVMAGDSGPVTDLPGRGPRCRIAVAASPRASRTVVDGLHDGALRVRLAAPPVDGAANDALRRFLADRLGVTVADVTVAHGQSGRRKLVDVNGIDAAEARRRLGLHG